MNELKKELIREFNKKEKEKMSVRAQEEVIPVHAKNLGSVSIKISAPKQNKTTKQYNAGIYDNTTGQPLWIVSPMVISKGIWAYDPANGADPSKITYSLTVRMKYRPTDAPSETDSEDIKHQRTMIEFMKNLDEAVVKYGETYLTTIFSKKYKLSDVRTLCSPCVKENIGDDGTHWPDELKFKISKNAEGTGPNCDPETGSFRIYNENREPLAIVNFEELTDILRKNTELRVVFQPKPYIIGGSQLGVRLELIQLLIKTVKKLTRPLTFAFGDEYSTENNAIEDEQSSTNNANTNSHENVQDSDNEGEIVAVEE